MIEKREEEERGVQVRGGEQEDTERLRKRELVSMEAS